MQSKQSEKPYLQSNTQQKKTEYKLKQTQRNL